MELILKETCIFSYFKRIRNRIYNRHIDIKKNAVDKINVVETEVESSGDERCGAVKRCFH